MDSSLEESTLPRSLKYLETFAAVSVMVIFCTVVSAAMVPAMDAFTPVTRNPSELLSVRVILASVAACDTYWLKVVVRACALS